MSGSRWVATPSWLSGSLRPFLYSSSVYSFHVFLISSASVRSILFLSFSVPIFVWNIPLLSLIFLSFPFYCFPLFLSLILHLPFSWYQPSLRDAFSWGIIQLSFWGENEEMAIYKEVKADNFPEIIKTYKCTNIGSKMYHSKTIFIKRMKIIFQQENFQWCSIIRTLLK